MQAPPLANGTETHPETDWNAIDWHQAEQRVRHLRHRIFRATQAGGGKRVRMKAEWEMARGQPIERILWKLNPIIREWANYHRRGTAKATFGMLDSWMFIKEVRYVKHTHPHKSTTCNNARTGAN